MKDRDLAILRQTVQEIKSRIQKYRDRNLGEQSTKASLIEPVLEALGWNVRDPDEVHREYRPTSKDCPVDYALALLREMKLFVEAKGLGENLSDRKWTGQILSYATIAGVEWCVLTDGNEYRFYNAAAAVDAEEKLFFRVSLSDSAEDEVIRALRLISRNNLGENILDVLWTSHFVDRRVKECLKRMLESRDKGLIRLIRKRTTKLLPKEISRSLRRLEIRFEASTVASEIASEVNASLTPVRIRSKAKLAGQKAAKTREVTGGATLQALIAASLLSPPLRLFRKYKGHELEATLLPDGKVRFGGETFDSCSSAAEHARATVTGRRMNTNGWAFWQMLDPKGNRQTLYSVRQRFLEG